MLVSFLQQISSNKFNCESWLQISWKLLRLPVKISTAIEACKAQLSSVFNSVVFFQSKKCQILTHIQSLFNRECCIFTYQSSQRGCCYQLRVRRLKSNNNKLSTVIKIKKLVVPFHYHNNIELSLSHDILYTVEPPYNGHPGDRVYWPL